jgi:hypothetical protein
MEETHIMTTIAAIDQAPLTRATLDLDPMIWALRSRPGDFEMVGRYVRHNPSGHMFEVDRRENLAVHTRCDCALLSVSPDQARRAASAIASWKQHHWRALQINREFASHFVPDATWKRLAGRLAAWLGRISAPVPPNHAPMSEAWRADLSPCTAEFETTPKWEANKEQGELALV